MNKCIKGLLLIGIFFTMLFSVKPKTVYADDSISFADGSGTAVKSGNKKTGGTFVYNTKKTECGYYSYKTGKFLKGWQKINGNWYYFNTTNKRAYQGFNKIDGSYYYFIPSNSTSVYFPTFAMVTDYTIHDGTTSSKSWVYFGDNGKALNINCWKQLGKSWYYFKKTDKGYSASVTGLQYIGNKYYYFYSGPNDFGVMATNYWLNSNGNRYYFDANGVRATGWKQINKKWYYFKSNGGMVRGWQKISGKYYYFESDGQALINTSKYIGGKVYKFNKDGVCTNK